MSLFQFSVFIFFYMGIIMPLSVYSHNTSTRSTKYDINQGVVSRTITVDKRGRGDFTTVQQAVNAVPYNNKRWILIHVKAGTYYEKVTVNRDKQFIYLKGESSRITFICYKDGGDAFKSTTFKMFADNFVATDITFVNTYNRPMKDVKYRISWAPAILIMGDKASFYRCGFISLQDTVSLFRGRHYFQSCYIEGAIDFIWGNGQSFFKSCNINVTTWRLGKGTSSFITAQGRESASQSTGFVFHACDVQGTGPAFLGRAFRSNSRVLYYKTRMANIITPLGWNAWLGAGHEKSITFAEVMCSGLGANKSKRVKWEKQLGGQDLNNLINVNKFVNQEGWLEKQPH